MTKLTWVGGEGDNANNANDWSSGFPEFPVFFVPQPGDTLDMQAGVMNIRGNDLAGNTLVIGASGTDTTTTLNLSQHANASLKMAKAGERHVTVNVQGHDTLNVSIEPYDFTLLTVNLAEHATLAGAFRMEFGSVTVDGDNGSHLVNNGAIHLLGARGQFATSVRGSGSFTVEAAQTSAGGVEFGGFVSHGQSVNVQGNAGQNAVFPVKLITHVQIDQPDEFKGAVGLGPYGEVDLQGLANADSYQIKQDILSIYSGCNVIEKLRLTAISNPDVPEVLSASVFKTATGVSVAQVSVDGSYHDGGTLLPIRT